MSFDGPRLLNLIGSIKRHEVSKVHQRTSGLDRLIRSQPSWVRLRGPVIQANGRLTFEDDLRSGGLLCFISMNASVRTELADSMVTPGEPGGD